MTNKELMYVEDALGHEKFMKTCATIATSKLTDPILSSYMNELVQKHTEIYNTFYKLL
jgi:hypothetical protein